MAPMIRDTIKSPNPNDIGDTVTVYQNPDSVNAKGSMYLFFNEKMSIVYAMTMFS